MYNRDVENSIRVVKEWLEESAKHGLENYIDDVKFEAAEEATKKATKLATKKRNIEIAKKMLQDNILIETIMKYTGLSKKQILKLK